MKKSPITQSDNENSMDSHERLKIYIERAQREHDLLISRTHIFLLYNSILMAGFALRSSISEIINLIPILGFITSLVWIYIGMRSLSSAEYFWRKVKETETLFRQSDRIFTDFFAWRKQSKFKLISFSVATYIGLVLPYLWLITWLIVFIIAIKFH